MHKRFVALLALLILLGFATSAFGQGVAAQNTDTRPMTRAAAVAMFVESDPALKALLQKHIRANHPLPLFYDVDYTQWYAPYIEAAFEAGIITGNEERVFRPGDILREEEAIALGARYHAMTHGEMVDELMATDGSWFNGVVMASVHGGITLPFPIRLGQPVQRTDLYAMMESMNIANPSQIAISYQPNPATQVAIQPIRTNTTTSPRPTTTTRPTTPVTNNPAPTQPTTPAPAAPVSQKFFAISMPTLGVKDLTITHPSDPFTKDGLHAPLKNGVGHLFSYPGKGGKILVYGHSSSYPWDVSQYTKIFRQINKLNVGDKLEVTYNGTLYTYEVTKKQTVPAEDMSAYQGAGGEELILYTCWPPDSIKERYLVHAKPV